VHVILNDKVNKKAVQLCTAFINEKRELFIFAFPDWQQLPLTF